jgi:hypothetical protein
MGVPGSQYSPEMRRRPVKNDGEEPDSRQGDGIGSGGPADQHRHRARRAANDNILRRRSLEPHGIDKDIEENGRGRQQCAEHIDENSEYYNREKEKLVRVQGSRFTFFSETTVCNCSSVTFAARKSAPSRIAQVSVAPLRSAPRKFASMKAASVDRFIHHVQWEYPTGCATRYKQAGNKGGEGDDERRQGFLPLIRGSEGRRLVIENASWCASFSCLSCERGMRERQLSQYEASVAPTRHCRRADRARSNGNASAPHVVGEGEAKGSAACQEAEGSRRIARANEWSGCGEALALPHRSSELVRAGLICVQQAPGQVAARDGARRSRGALDRLWLPMPGTALATHSADNPSGRPGTGPASVHSFS